MSDFRDEIKEFLEDVLYGPAVPGEEETMRSRTDNPLGTYQYGLGVLYPQNKCELPAFDDTADSSPVENDKDVSGMQAPHSSNTERDDDELYQSDQFFPSAYGFSFICRMDELEKVVFKIRYSWYMETSEKDPEQKSSSGKITSWHRKSNAETVRPAEMKQEKSYYRKVLHTDAGRKLVLQLRCRKDLYNGTYMTASLINEAVAENKSQFRSKAYTQIALSAEGVNFLPLPGKRIDEKSSEDEKTNAFLYRKVKEYAVGHGAAVKTAKFEGGTGCTGICLDFMPVAEVAPADTQGDVQNLSFNMRLLADEESFDSEIVKLDALAKQYEHWINRKIAILQQNNELDEIEKTTAVKHENLCREVLKRLRTGISLLKEDDDIAQVFRWANLAMFEQRTRVDIMPWEDSEREPQQGLDNKSPKEWRPFQIAFIVSLIPDMVNPKGSDYRNIVDLIWFPTGGGKTEAYLGLAAFTILWRRYKEGQRGTGTAVLMRYTLRLLASQQTARALALIAALEMIRRDNVRYLGKEPVSLGFFAGDGASYNRRADAVKELKNAGEHKFIIEKCPHCGRKITKHGANNFAGARAGKAYLNGISTDIVFKKKTVILYCPNSLCEFNGGIPFFSIDEDIYEHPPSFIIGTVDKLAMLPYKPEMREIFGDNGQRKPPALILQDELHLISGALGSIAGAYEILIEKLCTENSIKPKIVSATATVARVKQQCLDLWGRDMRVFPAPGPVAGHNFFSKPVTDSTKMRRYLGLMLPGLSGIASQSIVAASLLAVTRLRVRHGGDCDNTIDPYWTLLVYFISLRELGTFSTLEQNEIRTLLIRLYKKLDNAATAKIRGPNTYNSVELTSRFDLSLVKKWMDTLGNRARVNKISKEGKIRLQSESDVVDICRATNMIQVGLDISRLGLMLMYRQPQTTAEYIQASSRIGRQQPGLVVVLYKSQSSRDRSHYEHFQYYHKSFYRDVESISLTPSSPQVIERTIHALLIGLFRVKNPHLLNPQGIMPSKNVEIQDCKAEIIDALRERNWSEYSVVHAERYLDHLLRAWESAGDLHMWAENFYRPVTGNPWLMTPPEKKTYLTSLEKWVVMQSMRNVDSSVKLIK